MGQDVRRNVSVEQRGTPGDHTWCGVEYIGRREKKITKGALTYIIDQSSEVRTQVFEAVAR